MPGKPGNSNEGWGYALFSTLPRCTLTLLDTQQKRYRGFSEITDSSRNWHCDQK
jgi:hypothetical protein